MANLLDYLKWRGDLLFEQDPFNEVDNLVLSQLSYIDFHDIVPADFTSEPITIREAAALYMGATDYKERSASIGPLISELTFEMLYMIGGVRRFADLKLTGYVNHVDEQNEKQFAAMTVIFPDNSIYVAYRGTDSTLTGWKEDFNMSFMKVVPAQTEAVAYLRAAATAHKGMIRTGGHSKGGNLAVYAALFTDDSIQKRMMDIYNNDGPGFGKETVEGASFAGLKARIHTIVPQSSVVGMLLWYNEEYEVVESNGFGIFQHDPFSWKVLGPCFVEVSQVSESSVFAGATLRQWIEAMDDNQKKSFVDGLFELLESMNCNNLNELNEDKLKKVVLLAKSWKNFDSETRRVIGETIKLLFQMAKENMKHI